MKQIPAKYVQAVDDARARVARGEFGDRREKAVQVVGGIKRERNLFRGCKVNCPGCLACTSTGILALT